MRCRRSPCPRPACLRKARGRRPPGCSSTRCARPTSRQSCAIKGWSRSTARDRATGGTRCSAARRDSSMDSRNVAAPHEAALGHLVTCVAMLWIAGVGLRLTILAVPPLIRAIHDEMSLSETQVGILSGLPPVLFMLAAVPGSLLIARLGARATLVAGLVIAALGGALRGAVPDFLLLCAATVIMAFGV